MIAMYGMNFDRNVLQVRTDWQNRIFDLTSHFQDGGYNVISRGKLLPTGDHHHQFIFRNKTNKTIKT